MFDDRLFDQLLELVENGDIDLHGPIPYINGILTPCWLWNGKRVSRNGYGRIRVAGRERAAHRVVYELLVGPIPKGRILDHKCRNRSCVNPDHTEPVTHQVNTLRGEAILFKRPQHYAQIEGVI